MPTNRPHPTIPAASPKTPCSGIPFPTSATPHTQRSSANRPRRSDTLGTIISTSLHNPRIVSPSRRNSSRFPSGRYSSESFINHHPSSAEILHHSRNLSKNGPNAVHRLIFLTPIFLTSLPDSSFFASQYLFVYFVPFVVPPLLFRPRDPGRDQRSSAKISVPSSSFEFRPPLPPRNHALAQETALPRKYRNDIHTSMLSAVPQQSPPILRSLAIRFLLSHAPPRERRSPNPSPLQTPIFLSYIFLSIPSLPPILEKRPGVDQLGPSPKNHLSRSVRSCFSCPFWTQTEHQTAPTDRSKSQDLRRNLIRHNHLQQEKPQSPKMAQQESAWSTLGCGGHPAYRSGFAARQSIG
jgi:hypothetical protein